MKARFHWLLHPVFLTCIALLLLNDLYLKYAFHNWMTGKLSDVTGLIALTIAGFALFTTRRWVIMIVVTMFFIWWKSPLSEPFVSFFNEQYQIPLYRVVDYTDYLAICFIPLTYFLKVPAYATGQLRQLAITGSGLISVFAFCATSGPYHRWYEYYRQDEIPFNEQIATRKTDKEILYALDPGHKGWRIDSVRYLPYSTGIRPWYQVQQTGDSVAQWVPVPDSIPVPFYYRQVSQPFYIIPEYIIDGDTLFGLEFSIENPAKKEHKRLVAFHSFRRSGNNSYNIYGNMSLYRKYKQHFKKLLREN